MRVRIRKNDDKTRDYLLEGLVASRPLQLLLPKVSKGDRREVKAKAIADWYAAKALERPQG